MIKRALLCSFILLFFFPVFLGAYPVIGTLKESDLLFRQLQEDLKLYHKASHSRGKISLPPLKLFVYHREEEDTLFSCAARLNIPYDTLATLNRLPHPGDFFVLKEILVPNQPGIFLPREPVLDLEGLIGANRETGGHTFREIVLVRKGSRESCLFFPGDNFHPVERAFFLKIMFRYPLSRKWTLTSGFGQRKNPFTGKPEFHKGIDIGAPVGTEVLAAGKGVVLFTGSDNMYGNYIIISHPGGFVSVYGHLSKILVKKGQFVGGGAYIGEVGSTGYSTGPHLHFELKKGGNPRDPMSVLY